ncbi:MAG: hypothetical protein LIO62_09080, partial [Clostridiales bacterium]|nr:hypothetical protein [Clostridiales bacterium]
IIQNAVSDCINLIRDDIKQCVKYVFCKENNYCFGFKHKIAAVLIMICPKMYTFLIKTKEKLKGGN